MIVPYFDEKSRVPAWLAGALLAWLPPWRRRLEEPIRRVLIVRPDRRVGNQIITSALVGALVDQRPEVEVHYLAPAGQRGLIEGLPGVEKVHALPRHPARHPLALWRLLRQLRAQRFDVAVDASHWHSFSLTAALLTRASGARWCIGHLRPGAAALLDQWVPTSTEQGWPQELATKVSLLAPLGVRCAAPRMRVLPSARYDVATQGWAKRAERGRRVVLWPTTRKASTCISVSDWLPVLQQLSLPHGAAIAVGWGPGEEALAARLVDRLEGADFDAFAMPPTTIAELGDWMAQADLVISGDTGPLHLAGAVCDQVMGIFRRSDGRRWLPPGERHRGYVLSPEGELEEIN